MCNHHCAEAQGLIHLLAERELLQLAGLHPGTLSVAGVRAMDRRLCRAVLRHWIADRGFILPDTRHLSRIVDEVLTAREDAQPVVTWRGLVRQMARCLTEQVWRRVLWVRWVTRPPSKAYR